MYKSNSGLGVNLNRFFFKLTILLSEKKMHLIRYCSYTRPLAVTKTRNENDIINQKYNTTNFAFKFPFL